MDQCRMDRSLEEGAAANLAQRAGPYPRQGPRCRGGRAIAWVARAAQPPNYRDCTLSRRLERKGSLPAAHYQHQSALNDVLCRGGSLAQHYIDRHAQWICLSLRRLPCVLEECLQGFECSRRTDPTGTLRYVWTALVTRHRIPSGQFTHGPNCSSPRPRLSTPSYVVRSAQTLSPSREAGPRPEALAGAEAANSASSSGGAWIADTSQPSCGLC
eukprot:scaffold3917_cov377-Prasinococcus_capsulatus_cf.AAC.15